MVNHLLVMYNFRLHISLYRYFILTIGILWIHCNSLHYRVWLWDELRSDSPECRWCRLCTNKTEATHLWLQAHIILWNKTSIWNILNCCKGGMVINDFLCDQIKIKISYDLNSVCSFYTPTKSWRGYIFIAVCLCVCVSVCVSGILVNKIPAERMHRFGRGFR